MASIAVAAGAVGTAAYTLTANTVDTITFDADLDTVEVISDGAAEAWYTLDGSTPAANGAASYYLPAAACSDTRQPRTSGDTVVKIVSTGTPKIRVQRGD